MSLATADPAAAARRRLRRPENLGGWWAILAAVLALAALSIRLLPDDLAYDPYSWAIWGRETAHLHLDTRSAATSVKPLPMLLDTGFAFAGRHLAGCWMFVARAATVAMFAILFRLARRLGGLAAAVTAVAGLAVSNTLLSYLFLRGMSEPMAAAATLGAVDFFLLRRHRAAVACLVAAAYLRPEAWPLLFVYLLWLAWQHSWRRRLAAVVVGTFVPFSWFLIDWFGARQFNRSAYAARSQSQGGPLVHHYPGLATFSETWKLASGPVVVLFVIGLVVSVVMWWRSGHPLQPAVLAPELVVSLVAVAWIAIDAVLAQGHLATGAPRYLLPGEALACATVGWVVVAIARRIGARRGHRSRLPLVSTVAALAVVTAALFPWFITVGRQLRIGANEGRRNLDLGAHLTSAIRLAGGREAMAACGPIATSAFEVPLVAWQLHVPLERVGDQVLGPGMVVFQQAGLPVIPRARAGEYRQIGGAGAATSSSWQVYTAC